MKQLTAMGRYDATSRLGALSGLSTLVVSAFHDRIARPEFGRALAAGVPGARYVEIANASHGVPIERPEQINNLLLEHFTQTKRAAQLNPPCASNSSAVPAKRAKPACLRERGKRAYSQPDPLY